MGLLDLFGGKKSEAEESKSDDKKPAAPEEKKPLKDIEVKRMYGQPSSFIDKLPWYEYLPEEQTFLLDDGLSVGAVFEVLPLPTEGRSEDWLADQRDQIEMAISDAFDEEPNSPWIIQQYTFDDNQLKKFIDNLRAYPDDHCRDSQYTQQWLDTMEKHLYGISKEGGLFIDEEVLGGIPWGGKMIRTIVVVYRRLPKGWKHPQDLTPSEDLNDVCDKFKNGLRECNIKLTRLGGKDFYEWMLMWFNPNPEMTNGNKKEFLELASYPGDDDLPYGDDFSESLFFSLPESDSEKQAWIFDDIYHQCIRVNKLRRSPKIGAITGESSTGEKVSSLMDKMPPGTVFVSTLIVTPQSDVEMQIDRIAQKSRGESTEATYARRDCETAKEIMSYRKKLYRSTMAVYIRAKTAKELKQINNQVCALLTSIQLQPYKTEDDPVGLNSYILNLPMVYEPKMDLSFKTSRPIWLQHMANISPMFGRNRGTGNPGMIMFNRGGEPITVDPFCKADRQKNAHGVLLGPTGAGKSATLNYWSAQIMAIHRPRMIIVEAGNSFGLLAEHFRANGLTVKSVQIKPGAGVSLAPFQDVHQLVDSQDGHHKISETDLMHSVIHIMKKEGISDHFDSLSEEEQTRLREKAAIAYLSKHNLDADEEEDDTDDLEDDQRDILGEAEIIATLMITGGEKEEVKRLLRSDRRMIRDAILIGAKKAVKEGRTTLTEDVAFGFSEISHDESYPEKSRERAFEMGESIRMYTDGFEGELFNNPADAWPDVDVTIVDLATLAKEGYQAQLALAYTSIMQNTNALAEKYQNSGRQIVMLTDEAHLITVNPLLSAFSVKIVKMWRKLNAWYWLATQNLEDFPNESKKILNMCEWLIALVAPTEEVEQLANFRNVSEEQKRLMVSAKKEQHKYVEGTILADKIETLFRNVPPSLYLSLAGTEGYEKAQRAELMKKYGITNLEAAEYVAAQIDHARGIAPKPPEPKARKSA